MINEKIYNFLSKRDFCVIDVWPDHYGIINSWPYEKNPNFPTIKAESYCSFKQTDQKFEYDVVALKKFSLKEENFDKFEKLLCSMLECSASNYGKILNQKLTDLNYAKIIAHFIKNDLSCKVILFNGDNIEAKQIANKYNLRPICLNQLDKNIVYFLPEPEFVGVFMIDNVENYMAAGIINPKAIVKVIFNE